MRIRINASIAVLKLLRVHTYKYIFFECTSNAPHFFFFSPFFPPFFLLFPSPPPPFLLPSSFLLPLSFFFLPFFFFLLSSFSFPPLGPAMELSPDFQKTGKDGHQRVKNRMAQREAQGGSGGVGCEVEAVSPSFVNRALG